LIIFSDRFGQIHLAQPLHLTRATVVEQESEVLNETLELKNEIV
jgi:DNA-binding XRE family transcriptional regulator